MRRNNHRSFAGFKQRFSRNHWTSLYFKSAFVSMLFFLHNPSYSLSHCPPRIFINPTSNCTKFINSNLESSSIVLNKYAENPFIYGIKYIPFIALVEFILTRKLRSLQFRTVEIFHSRRSFFSSSKKIS